MSTTAVARDARYREASAAAGLSSAVALPAQAGHAVDQHPYRWAVLAGVWIVYACFGMTVASIAPLVEPITRELGISHSAMGSVLGAWPLVYIGCAALCGALTDRLGPRYTLTIAMLVVAASGLLRGLADSYSTLFLSVAVFGLGGPLVSIGAPKVVSLWFANEERGLAMGVYVSGSSFGMIASLAAANSIFMPWMDGDWRRVMFLYAGFALAAGLVWIGIGSHPEVRALERRVRAEPRARQLQVFADLVRRPEVRLLLLLGTGIFFFNHALNNWLPEILRAGGMDAKSAGYWASIPTAIGIGAVLVIPRFATARRRHAVLATLIIGAGAATLLIGSGSTLLLGSGLICQGLARGAITAVALLCLVETRGISPRYAGSASGLFFTAGELGGVLGPVVIGAMYDASGGFEAGLLLLTAVCALLLLLLLKLRRAAA